MREDFSSPPEPRWRRRTRPMLCIRCRGELDDAGDYPQVGFGHVEPLNQRSRRYDDLRDAFPEQLQTLIAQLS